MELLLIIFGFFAVCALIGYLSNNDDIIGFFANLLWFLWRNIWVIILIIIVWQFVSRMWTGTFFNR